jgi:two-component system, response regulator PdtaR
MSDAQQQLHEAIETLKAAEKILESFLKALNEPQPATFGPTAPETCVLT